MMQFLIQKIGGKVTFDFGFELIQAIEYNNWKYQNRNMQYAYGTIEELVDTLQVIGSDFIPVGSIEFVMEYARQLFPGKDITPLFKPLNVPRKFLRSPDSAWCLEGTVESVYEELLREGLDTERLFVKSMERLKDERNGLFPSGLPILDKFSLGETVQVRRELNIKSEWRCFVTGDELLGCQWYSGDFLEFPDRGEVRRLVDDWIGTRCYGAYPTTGTLDLAVIVDFDQVPSTRLIVLEAHEFYSCGLYGFSDYSKLPYMFYRAWKTILDRGNSL